MKTKHSLALIGASILIALGIYYYPNPNTSITQSQSQSVGKSPMNYPEFHCALEKDHTPVITPEADKYYQEARRLEKTRGWEDWPAIVNNYEKAIELNHWKAMNNLAILYGKGGYGKADYDNGNVEKRNPTGVKPDRAKQLALYAKMVELDIPLGYYNWSLAIRKGYIPNTQKGDATAYMFRAAELGSPQAQIYLGNYFAFGLPTYEQRDDIADKYFRCAGRQDNPETLEEVASFYEIAKKNMPLATYFYQKAASLGNYKSMMVLVELFKPKDNRGFDFDYLEDNRLASLYQNLFNQLGQNSDLRFPNLIKDHPLPRHPTQGYDADNPEVRPDY